MASKARELANLGNAYSDGALSNRNLIINGAMQVAQRGTSATVSDNSNEGYSTVDRFSVNFNTSMGGSVTASQSSQSPNGFSSSLKIQCASTTTVTGSQGLEIIQFLEAQNLQSIGAGTVDAQKLTLSFWAKTDNNFTDTMSIAARTPDGTPYYYVEAFNPSTTWTRHTITIPALTNNTINNDNEAGLIIWFRLCNGGTFAGTTSDWTTTRLDVATGTNTTFMSSTSNAFYLTGVQLEVGDTATPFEHRSYGQELALCQRYFFKKVDGDIRMFSSNDGTPYRQTYFFFPVEMRATPSVSGLTASVGTIGNFNTRRQYAGAEVGGVSSTQAVDFKGSPSYDAEL